MGYEKYDFPIIDLRGFVSEVIQDTHIIRPYCGKLTVT